MSNTSSNGIQQFWKLTESKYIEKERYKKVQSLKKPLHQVWIYLSFKKQCIWLYEIFPFFV